MSEPREKSVFFLQPALLREKCAQLAAPNVPSKGNLEPEIVFLLFLLSSFSPRAKCPKNRNFISALALSKTREMMAKLYLFPSPPHTTHIKHIGIQIQITHTNNACRTINSKGKRWHFLQLFILQEVFGTFS